MGWLHMKKGWLILCFGILIASVSYVGLLAKGLKIGKPVKNFVIQDSHGEKHSLLDYKGKYVVLEWINHGCPFVKKHYNSGNMQSLQKNGTRSHGGSTAQGLR